jgi:hypothetical protein
MEALVSTSEDNEDSGLNDDTYSLIPNHPKNEQATAASDNVDIRHYKNFFKHPSAF